MIRLFATEEIPLSDIRNALKKEGAEVSPIVLTSQLRDKSNFLNICQAFFVCSERSISIVGERTKQVRDLIGESAVLTVCATAISSEHRKSLIACGATRIVTPQTFATSHIVERLLSQVIFDGDIKPSKYGSLVGATKVMREIYRHIGILAPLDEPILIVGETGTGKELIASEFHSNSGRDTTFICVNFAEITPELLPSELFGHEQGAFTNAVKSRKGLLVEAGKGTIFLDEIGELDLASQAKILRVLEEKKVRRVGANSWENVSARILAATNRNLDEECSEKRFRLDLYQRLKAFVIELPPLRERKADIPLLVRHFMDEYGQQYDKKLSVSDDLIDDLFKYDWQGNVRELRNVIRKASAYADSNDQISKIALREITSIKTQTKSNVIVFDPTNEKLEDVIHKVEKTYLKSALSKTNGNVSEASKLAGIGRATFYKKLGLDEHDN